MELDNSKSKDTLVSGMSTNLDDHSMDDFSWEEELQYEGTLLGSCNELLIWIDRGVEEETGWALVDAEVALQLHDASLLIRQWKSSCSWLAEELNKSKRLFAEDNAILQDLEEDVLVESIFEILEARCHPLSVTLRSCLDEIRKHLNLVNDACIAKVANE
jgi:hypothetical protein